MQSTNRNLKLANLIVDPSCGPYIFKIYGQYAEYFQVSNNSLFLVDNSILNVSGNYAITISIEDPSNRFDSIQKTYTLVVKKCENLNITTTLDPESTTTTDPESTTTTTTADPEALAPPIYLTTQDFLCDTIEQVFTVVPDSSHLSYFSGYFGYLDYIIEMSLNSGAWNVVYPQSRISNSEVRSYINFTDVGGYANFRVKAVLIDYQTGLSKESDYKYDSRTYVLCDV